MTLENQYTNGISSQVLYPINGGANDWQYGEQAEKGKSLSFLPEVGYSFWPMQADIDPLNKDAFYINIKALRLLHNYGKLTSFQDAIVHELQAEVPFSMVKFGTSTSPLTVTLTPVSDNILTVSPPKTFSLGLLESVVDGFDYTLDPQIEVGEEIEFEIKVDNGSYAIVQPVKSVFGSANVALFDPGNDISFWEDATEWDVTDATYYSAPTCITDSKDGNYTANETNLLLLKTPVTVADASSAYLSFWAKWELAEESAYTQVAVSVNGGDFIPLCGNYTKLGTNGLVTGQPIFTGIQDGWVREEMDLTPYLQGSTPVEMTFAFTLGAGGGFLTKDGFYFDDLKLVAGQGGEVSTTDFDASIFSVGTRPNPASDLVVFDLKGGFPAFTSFDIEVFNALGQPVHQLRRSSQTAQLDVADWVPGVYFYQVKHHGKVLAVRRFVVG
jgi:hypothetical protein